MKFYNNVKNSELYLKEAIEYDNAHSNNDPAYIAKVHKEIRKIAADKQKKMDAYNVEISRLKERKRNLIESFKFKGKYNNLNLELLSINRRIRNRTEWLQRKGVKNREDLEKELKQLVDSQIQCTKELDKSLAQFKNNDKDYINTKLELREFINERDTIDQIIDSKINKLKFRLKCPLIEVRSTSCSLEISNNGEKEQYEDIDPKNFIAFGEYAKNNIVEVIGPSLAGPKVMIDIRNPMITYFVRDGYIVDDGNNHYRIMCDLPDRKTFCIAEFESENIVEV